MDGGIKLEILSRFELNDMAAYYLLNENKQVELVLVPTEKERDLPENWLSSKCTRGESLIQTKLVGDHYPGTYSGGTTMRNSETVEMLKYADQKHSVNGNHETIVTTLTDERDHFFIHTLEFDKGEFALSCHTAVENRSRESITLECLSSFSIGFITPFEKEDAPECLKVHRIRSKWSQEGRLVTEPIEDLQLETPWTNWHVNSVRYGAVGSMPVKGYFPFGAVEDYKNNVIWAAALGVESSWEMEFYRRDDELAVSGGLADREFGHWMKTLEPGASFETPSAILAVCSKPEGCESLIDYASQRITEFGQKFVNAGPKCEQNLPIMFNEYCTTWGLPSHENIKGILNAVKGKGLDYFVVDCGWYVEEGKNWGRSMGDYVPSDKLFPNSLKAVSDDIKAAGMKPGLWFEIDNVGCDSHIFNDREDLLLKRDGYPITTNERRFFDMSNPEVIDYLTRKVIGQLKKYGFEYIKMDYNDTIGIGCDGAESLGEGLRRDREASVNFVKKIRDEIPGIILENCSSGGHKLEPLMMSICSMASFSDAHECEHIPLIAAALHRTVLPRQSQIWAVIRKNDSVKRIAYTLVNTFLGRMCFSGDVTELTDEQWKAIEDGMAFYRKIVPAIKNGYSYIYTDKTLSDKHLNGYQAVVRLECEEGKLLEGLHSSAYAVVHIFRNAPGTIEIKLPKNCPKTIESIYSGTNIDVKVEGDKLIIKHSEEMEAVAILLK